MTVRLSQEVSTANAVTAALWPRDTEVLDVKDGEEVPLVQLPQSAIKQQRPNLFEVHLNPDDIPDGYLDKQGMADIEVSVRDTKQHLAGQSTGTVQLGVGKLEGTWVDAGAYDEIVAASRSSEPESVGLEVNMDLKETTTTGDSDRRTASGDESPTCIACVCVPSPTKLYEKSVWATISTAYPKENGQSKAWLEYSKSYSHSSTFGMAVNFGGGFESSGTRTVSGSWGQKWAAESAKRSFRVQVAYGYYRYDYKGTDCDGDEESYYRWRPIRETGGTKDINLSINPSFSDHCTTVSKGIWSRYRGDGKAYTNSRGVKIQDYLGFKLSVKSNFATEKTLHYNAPYEREMCGNDSRGIGFSGKHREL